LTALHAVDPAGGALKSQRQEQERNPQADGITR
jgi:hypothetical protein